MSEDLWGGDAPLLDRKRLSSLGLAPEEWAELVALFEGSAAEAARDLRAAAAAGDHQRIGQIAHKLKGTSGNLGFSAVAAFCAKLEAPGLDTTALGLAVWERFSRLVETSVEEARRI